MGRTSTRRRAAKGKSVRFESASSQECSDENNDVRLQKRPKRSCTNRQRINQNSHSSATMARLGSLGSHDNNNCDLRSERRLRRKRTNKQCYKPKSRSKASKATKKNITGEKSELLKPLSFSNIRSKHGDYDHIDNDNDVVALSDEEDVYDPVHIKFLQCLRRNGNSYSAEFVDEIGVTKLIDYDIEEDVRPSMRFGFENQLLPFDEDVDEDDSKDVDEDDLQDVHSNLKHGLDADCELEDDEILYLRYLDGIEDDENTTPKKSKKVEEIQLGNESNLEDESDDICQDYRTFLDYLEKKDEETMFEDDDDVQILTTDENPRDVIDVDNSTLAKDGNRSQSQSRFRKELLEILRSPYNPQQRKELWDEVSDRKPKVKDRQLRNRTKSCRLKNSPGQSYLDQHKDFADQIELAKNDDLKTLNLLRGFFYWLKNLPHGMLPPWKDPSLLEV
ncbi:hypothetical protein G4B88_029983 [Cannabis sativa]|uniref:Uncharacterized protein n=1 Tax=Cannabis sativa TaxID=3483 RepID=A0A7J6GAL6_CANSA|nr:hypothetical protein G4B88_029983 [Cannabis sativa]